MSLKIDIAITWVVMTLAGFSVAGGFVGGIIALDDAQNAAAWGIWTIVWMLLCRWSHGRLIMLREEIYEGEE